MVIGLKSGTLLDHGKYRIERVLGHGGFGITYLVTDIGLDKQRAVKEFFPKDYCDREDTSSQVSIGTSGGAQIVEKLKAKFIKEARNIANLDLHNSIIRIHSVFEENSTAYYVMDYIEGESLSSLVKREGPLDPARAVKYIREVGEALEYVHSHFINHLDVKPANIMVRKRDGKPILIDFGLSKQYDREGTQTSTTPLGISAGFSAIEQYNLNGIREFSPQTDVYSLGATLYYLISGEVPPPATDLIEKELTFKDDFPQYLRLPIRMAMSAQRQSRPESVERFLQLLEYKPTEGILADVVVREPTVASPVSVQQPTQTSTYVLPNESVPESPRIEDQTINNHNQPPVNKPNKPLTKPSAHADINTGTKRNRFLWIASAGILAIGILGIILYSVSKLFIPSNDDYSKENTDTETVMLMEETPAPEVIPSSAYVANLKINTSLGEATYSGNVDANRLPHGKGVATWQTGEGKRYDGEWVHGKMEGKTNYTERGGDTFVGTFKNNEYSEGKYTVTADGDYFIGTFKNGQPDKGKWYNKNGVEYQY